MRKKSQVTSLPIIAIIFIILILMFVNYLSKIPRNNDSCYTGNYVYAPSSQISSQAILNSPSFIDFLNENNLVVGGVTITGSMRPAISDTSLIIKKINFEERDLKIGDIICGKIVMHRIIEIGYDEEGRYYITKGDNTNTPDAKMRFADVRCVVVGIFYT